MNRITIDSHRRANPAWVEFSWILEVGVQGEQVYHEGKGTIRMIPSPDLEYVWCDASFEGKGVKGRQSYCFISRNVRNIPITALECVGYHLKGANMVDTKVVDRGNAFNGFADLFDGGK